MLLIDVCENYSSLGKSLITLFGRNKNNALVKVEVEDTPFSICVAVGDNFTYFERLKNDLNYHLLNKPSPCRTLRCPCGNDSWGVFREPCVNERRFTQEAAVVSVQKIMRRGFDGFEEHLRPFAFFELRQSYYFKAAADFLQNVDVGQVKPEHRGIHDKFSTGVENFLWAKEISSFEWLAFPNKPIVKFNDVVKGEDMVAELISLILDIEISAVTYNKEDVKNALYPIVIISCVLSPSGAKQSFVLKTNSLEDPPRLDTLFFKDERDLLMSFKAFFMKSDPDLVEGYNTNGFDIPYILRRARNLEIPRFEYMSRIQNQPMVFRTSLKEKSGGSYDVTVIDCPGRIFMDLFPLIKTSNLKLEGNKLSNVADYLDIGSKDDVKYEEIHLFFHRDVESRAKLIKYCERDVELCVLIETRFDFRRRLFAKSRVLRLRARDTLDRGLGYQLTTLVRMELKGAYCMAMKVSGLKNDKLKTNERLRSSFLKIQGYEELWNAANRGEQFKGAFVFEPIKGLHQYPVVTLDFNSLYPSLTINFNICSSTHLSSPQEGSHNSPAGFGFVPSSVREGVVPRIMRELLAKRAEIRSKMKSVTDPDVLSMLDAEQTEMKLAANALYGQRGTITSDLCCMSCAASTTSWGVQYIKKVCEALEACNKFRAYNLKVVYGDTDSLMIGLRSVKTLEEGNQIALELQKWVNVDSGLLQGVMKMGLENVSMPFLALAKKHYVKCIWDDRKKTMVLKKSGLDTRSTIKFASELRSTVLTMGMIYSATPQAIESFIREEFKKLLGNEVSRSLLKHTANISKPLEEYDGDTPHIRAARQLEAVGIAVRPGDRVEYYFCNVSTSKKDSKSERSVAAQLVDQYDFHLKSYVEETLQVCEKSLLYFIQGNTPKQKVDRLKSFAMNHPEVESVMKNAPVFFLPTFLDRSFGVTTRHVRVGEERTPKKVKKGGSVRQSSIADYFS
jgi:DNA polymerase delta subunit 1